MGLDQYLTLVKHFVHGGRDGEPTLVDGFPLTEMRMEVLDWRKHIWVHQFFCELYEASNECRDVEISASQLEMLADKLERWVDDPDALPPIEDKFRGSFFGVRETDKDYEECRDLYRADAKDEAKLIRKAIKWIKQAPPSEMSRIVASGGEYRTAVYRSSW